jgi:hypothetical protein
MNKYLMIGIKPSSTVIFKIKIRAIPVSCTAIAIVGRELKVLDLWDRDGLCRAVYRERLEHLSVRFYRIRPVWWRLYQFGLLLVARSGCDDKKSALVRQQLCFVMGEVDGRSHKYFLTYFELSSISAKPSIAIKLQDASLTHPTLHCGS